MSEARIARRIRVHGLVQGVWFRAWTMETARGLGLDGWVRNRTDGTVELVVVGPTYAVETMIARCHQGSSASRVDGVEVEDTPGIIPAGFTQKPTV